MKSQANNVVKLFPDENRVYRMIHFYRDNTTAMIQHINNLIATYGKKQVLLILKDFIQSGAFDDND
jgi:hypothetical protein